MRALLFDFDGVVVLSDRPRFDVLQKVALGQNIIIQESLFPEIVGRTTKYFLTRILPKISDEKIVKIISEYEKEYKGNIIKYVKPNALVVSFLREYTGPKKLALASMSSRIIIEKILEHLGINDIFDLLVCKEEVVAHKPDPEIYLKAAKLLGVMPSTCIVIEDSLVGMEAAKRAGMDIAVVLGENSPSIFSAFSVKKFITTTEDLFEIARE